MRTEASPERTRTAPCPCGSGRPPEECCRRGGAGPEGDPPARAAPAAPAAGPVAPPLVLGCTFVLAFCSIVYELLLGQTLSAFLGNTVLRYSVTIGLYLLSMGMGALLAGRRLLRSPIVSLQAVEVLLTLLGGASVMVLFAADAAGLPVVLLSILAHALIVAVGVLTGLEIPFLMELRAGSDRGAPGEVLGVDYAGAFLGTVAFALLFYPRVGLVPTAFAVASLNAAVGLVLPRLGGRVPGEDRRLHRRLGAVQGVLLAALLVCLLFSSTISEFGLGLYLGD